MVDQAIYNEEYYIENCEGYTNDGCAGPRISTLLSHLPEHARTIIDIGCGRGEVAKTLIGKLVISLDYSLASMKYFYKNNGINKPFIRHNLIDGVWWLRTGFFDAIILSDVIEHIDESELLPLIPGLLRILKEDGLILIDTPLIGKEHASKYHVSLKQSVEEVANIFQTEDYQTELVKTHWFRKPEHCNIILRKVDR